MCLLNEALKRKKTEDVLQVKIGFLQIYPIPPSRIVLLYLLMVYRLNVRLIVVC
jgi:hypothetical protein